MNSLQLLTNAVICAVLIDHAKTPFIKFMLVLMVGYNLVAGMIVAYQVLFIGKKDRNEQTK